MTTRSQVVDKHHRLCKECGESVHVNAIRGESTHKCENCGGEFFTRDKSKVRDK